MGAPGDCVVFTDGVATEKVWDQNLAWDLLTLVAPRWLRHISERGGAHVPPGRSTLPPIVGAASESPQPRQAERHARSQSPSQPAHQVQHPRCSGCGGGETSLGLRPSSSPACAPGTVFDHGGLLTCCRVPRCCRPDDSFLAGSEQSAGNICCRELPRRRPGRRMATHQSTQREHTRHSVRWGQKCVNSP